MNRSKHGLKGLGLALVLLALTAFMATAVAQAAEWRIEGKKLETKESVTGSVHVQGNFLVPAQKLEILCSTHIIEGAFILPNGEAEGSILLSNCKTWQNGKESPGCKPIDPVFATGHARPILHNGLTYMLVEPPKGGVYATAMFNPAKCALPEENEVTGTAVGECINSKLESGAKLCEEESAAHLGKMAPQALFPKDQ